MLSVIFYPSLAKNPSLGQESLSKLKSELGGKSHSELAYHQLDITDEESCKKFAAHLKQQHNGIDVLVNNAGFAFNVSSIVLALSHNTLS